MRSVADRKKYSDWFLADRTATQCMIGYLHNAVICMSVRPSDRLPVRLCICGSQGWCTGLKVVSACS